MMRLRARIREVTGRIVHLLGATTLGVIRIPDPAEVEVVEQDAACYLLRLDNDGQCIADTWHASVEAAKAQAMFEFGIEESDWKEV